MASHKKVSFVLDKHEYYLNVRSNDKKNFFLSINPANGFFDMMSNPTLIMRGYKTIITVKPISVVSDTNIKDLPVSSRKCRFEHEIPENMTFFKSYSVSSCNFDCMLKYSTEQCMCIPWDLPRPDNNSNIPICDNAGNFCFHTKLSNYTFLGSSCSCLPTCNSLKFSFTKDTSPINLDDHCQGISHGVLEAYDKSELTWNNLMKLSSYAKRQKTSPTNWNSVFSKSEEEAREMCKKLYTEDMAIVEIQVEGQSYMKMRQSLRATTTDKVAAIGGTLGLFTGFSVVAIVEILYWMCIGLTKIFNDTILRKKSTQAHQFNSFA